MAGRAGVDLDDVNRFVDLGLLITDGDGCFTEGDVRRARMYRGLELAGLPTDALIQAIGRGELTFEFLDLPVYDRYAALGPWSFREISDREGVPLNLLLLVREAIGFAQADADDRMREDELRVVPMIRLQLSRGWDPTVIEQSLRVYGDALRRITETEADWWRTQVALPALSSGLNAAEMLSVTNRWGEEFASVAEQAILAIYHANQEHAWTENTFDVVEDALDRGGLWKRIQARPAIGFVDLAGYTRLTEERGDQAAAEVVKRLTSLVERSAGRHDGKVVKRLGDGVMVHFREPGSAVLASLETLDALADAGLPKAHIGLDAGPVVFEGGDYFGRTVNVAARIAEHAEAGHLLVSQDVVDGVGSTEVVLTPIGSVTLRGVSRPVRLYSAARSLHGST